MPTAAGPDRPVLLALLLSALGHVVHNLAEFSVAVLWGLETLFPLAVTAVVGLLLRYRPGRIASAVAAGWALLVLVGGGGSVLPLGFWPFEPEQSASHYLAHLVYAMAQLPLLWVAFRGLRVEAGSEDPTEG